MRALGPAQGCVWESSRNPPRADTAGRGRRPAFPAAFPPSGRVPGCPRSSQARPPLHLSLLVTAIGDGPQGRALIKPTQLPRVPALLTPLSECPQSTWKDPFLDGVTSRLGFR